MWQIQISSILRGLSIYALQILTVLPWYFVAIVGGGKKKRSQGIIATYYICDTNLRKTGLSSKCYLSSDLS